MPSIHGRDADVVSTWLLDADQYKAELKSLSIAIRQSNAQAKQAELVQNELAKSMGGVQGALQRAKEAFGGIQAAHVAMAGAIGGTVAIVGQLAGSFMQAAAEGAKIRGVMGNLRIDIDAAQQATGGMVDRLTLATSANRAMALGLNFTATEFASLSKAAVAMSQVLGTDASEAVNDLITGLGRQSSAILDNLGIVVKAEEAYDQYAKALGKSASELTEAEKRTAFQTAALESLQRKSAEVTINQDEAARSSARVTDAINRMKEAIAGSTGLNRAWATTVEFLSKLAVQTATMFDSWTSFSDFMLGRTQQLIDMANKVERFAEPDDARQLRLARERAGARDQTGVSGLFSEMNQNVPLELQNRKGQRGKIKLKPVEREEGTDWMVGEVGGEMQAAHDAAERIREQTAKREKRKLRNIRNFEEQEREKDLMADAANAAARQEQEVDKLIKAKIELIKITREANLAMKEMAVDGLSALSEGFADAIFAAVQGQQSFGQAIASMTSSVLIGVAKQATVRALFEAGAAIASLAVLDFRGAALHGAAAGKFALVAGVTGAIGVGIGGAAGGGQNADAAGASGRGGRFATPAPAQQFGTREKREKQVIVVEILAPTDPAAALMFRNAKARAA